MNRSSTRRDFLRQAAVAGAAGPLLAGQTGALAPEDKPKSPNEQRPVRLHRRGGQGR